MANYTTQGAVKINLMSQSAAEQMEALVGFIDSERDEWPSGEEMDENAREIVLQNLDEFLESLKFSPPLTPEARERVLNAVSLSVEESRSIPEKRRLEGEFFYLGSRDEFDPELVAEIVSLAVVQFDLPPVGFTYAEVCDNPLRTDGFGGGTVLVTKNETFFHNAQALLLKETSNLATKQPVSSAACEGNPAKVKKLLEAGGDLNEADGQPLRWAMRAGHAEVVDYLLNAGARIDWPNLPDVQEDHPDIQARLDAEKLKREASSAEGAAPRIARRAF